MGGAGGWGMKVEPRRTLASKMGSVKLSGSGRLGRVGGSTVVRGNAGMVSWGSLNDTRLGALAEVNGVRGSGSSGLVGA